MGLALSLPRKYFSDDQAIPAPRTLMVCNCALDIASVVPVMTFRLSDRNTQLKYTVEPRPLDFNEVARHFARVTTRIEWPVEEADTE